VLDHTWWQAHPTVQAAALAFYWNKKPRV
jgi:hypothetical protein